MRANGIYYYIFLTGLLPGFFLLLYIFRKNPTVRRLLLFVANLVFCIMGGGVASLFLLFLICVLTWGFSRLCFKYHNRILLMTGCMILLTPLLIFKYTSIMSGVFAIIGISFFTFEAISCLCDIYRKEVENVPSVADIFLYLSFFPTIVSGPIVRFKNFKNGMYVIIGLEDFQEGAALFLKGLCKKVLLADKLALLVDFYFDGVAAGSQFSALGLWVGSFAYTLQLYFDFSGYSDMAIGIGKAMGYELPINFKAPYQAKSIQDFWRRWHISLSSWFRDYVYIPLGGSRGTAVMHIRNLLVVWALTGIWHGADFTFLIWGIGYFILLALEKYVPIFKENKKKWYGHLYTLFFVNLLWVPFRAENCFVFTQYLKGMIGISSNGIIEEKGLRFLPFLIFCALLCAPWEKITTKYQNFWCFKVIRGMLMAVAGFLALCAVINASYAPYIYGNF
ncbi:MAG: hypothetical protein NC400_04720 [Clostridium sp.]|nr:hypothetical protein [Clostridium sp.]